jgi:tetraacyldisaccharide 4'-kinase
LRAPLGIQLEKAHALLVVGPPDGAASVLDRAKERGMRIFHAALEPDRSVIAAIGARKVLAFAGIGNPDKFFTTLTAAGVGVAERVKFPDHYPYTAADAQNLLARAQAKGLMLVTTEKDLVRLSGAPQLETLAGRASTLPVRLVIEEADTFRQLVVKAIKRG